MAKIHKEKQTSLTDTELRNLMDERLQKHNLAADWNADGKCAKLSYMGMTGEIKLNSGLVTVDVELPVFLSAMKKNVDERLDNILNRI